MLTVPAETALAAEPGSWSLLGSLAHGRAEGRLAEVLPLFGPSLGRGNAAA